MSWSLSKTTRFPASRRKDSCEFTLLPSTLNLRSTGIGFGKRWNPQKASGFDSPPPGTYNLPDLSSNRGPKIVKEMNKNEKGRFCTPGPGTYEPLKPLGLNKPKFAIKGRINRRNLSDTPAPGTYSPTFGLTHFSGYANISFGFGERTEAAKKFDGPGPGAYDIFSKFDKHK
jgi:hypothetical protein